LPLSLKLPNSGEVKIPTNTTIPLAGRLRGLSPAIWLYFQVQMKRRWRVTFLARCAGRLYNKKLWSGHNPKEAEMKRFIAAVIFMLLASSSASAATAIWTGRSEQVQTVTYKIVWRCEYNYLGHTFWRLFENFCPPNIQVQ
jgi:hypothetical protein